MKDIENKEMLSEEERRRLLNELIKENRVSYFIFGFSCGILLMLILVTLTL